MYNIVVEQKSDQKQESQKTESNRGWNIKRTHHKNQWKPEQVNKYCSIKKKGFCFYFLFIFIMRKA